MYGRRGLVFWHNAALITFGSVAIGMMWTVMGSGFSSSDVMKDVIEDAVVDSSEALQVVGKMTGRGIPDANQVTVTATPVTTTVNGIINTGTENIKVTYKIVKDGSYTITQENIYVGSLYGKTYNSVGEALDEAKRQGLIQVNPLVDSEKPDTTSAFFYWIIDGDSNKYLQNGEIATLVIVYSERDRPATGEYMKIEVHEPLGTLLSIERNVPNISSSILDFGGKVKKD